MAILKEAESAIAVTEVLRSHGISAATFYKWRSKYGGLEASELKRVKELEQQLSDCKPMVAELTRDNRALKNPIEKSSSPTGKREAVDYLVDEEPLPIRVACEAIGLARAGYYKKPAGLKEKDQPVIDALNQIVGKHGRWGFSLCFAYLRNQGHACNHKRVWRIYKQMGLNLPRLTKKRLPKIIKEPLIAPQEPNTMWAIDFMYDTLYYGRSFRTLNVIEESDREVLAIEVDLSLPAARVVRAIEQLEEMVGLQKAIRLDNGSELRSAVFTGWCQEKDIELKFIQPGKPQQNAFIERFNHTYRHDVLNAHIFESLEQNREITEEWIHGYN